MIKNRNPLVVLLLVLVTCGFYGLFWLYATSGELHDKGKLEMSPVLLLLLALIPFVNLYAFWKYCAAIGSLSEESFNPIVLFIILLVFFPAFYVLAQMDLNKHASATE